jgi:hypothetical protein
MNFLQHELSAKTLYRNFATNIPRNEAAKPHSQFLHSCIFERLIYCHNQSTYFAIYKSLTETSMGKLGTGRAVLLLGIHKSDLLFSVLSSLSQSNTANFSEIYFFTTRKSALL